MFDLPLGLQLYMSVWISACVVALGLVLYRPAQFSFTDVRYWRFLAQPWKLLTFSIATAGITLVAPYTGDPTWDYYDALFMATFTFISAPWSLGTLYRGLQRHACVAQLWVALCLWLFSASWSYDAYLLWRDGYYPITWTANLAASSMLYCSAGLLWSLEYQPKRGVQFAFQAADWPQAAIHQQFTRILLYALPFMLLGSSAVFYFLWPW